MRKISSVQLAQSVPRELASKGYCVVQHAVDPALLAHLIVEARNLWDEEAFRAARIGNGDNMRLATAVRSDFVLWLDEPTATPAQRELMREWDELRTLINQHTFLGLFEWEGHLACYPPGARYQRHLDVFANARQRQVSTVLYLNESWKPGDGGELRLWTTPASPEWTPESPFIDIEPRAGTLVTFLSEEMYHEVLPSQTDRFSITGWFRTRK